MTYNKYPHRGNLADIVFDENYDYWVDYDKEYERFDYINLVSKELDALREWTAFNGPSGSRNDAPNVYMNHYVKHRLAGIPASRIKGIPKDHKKHAHTLCKLLEPIPNPSCNHHSIVPWGLPLRL